MSEINTGEPVSRFIIHIAASLWAAMQVPEITVAIQSLLKAGFRRALQVELLVIIPYLKESHCLGFTIIAIIRGESDQLPGFQPEEMMFGQ
jgi:hypothetical protein